MRSPRYWTSSASTLRYGKWLGLLGLLWGLLCFLLVRQGYVWAWILAWPAVSFALVAISYLVRTPALLGKRDDGTRAWYGYPLTGPFMGLMWFARLILVRFSEEPDWNEVEDGIYVGRRVDAERLPQGPLAIIDLTCEFLPHASVLETTRCFPTLDGSCPSPERLKRWTEEVASIREPLYIHCAAGHGRSAMLAACVLIRRKLAPDVAGAVQQMQAARPKIHLAPEQQRCAERAMQLQG